MNRIFSAILVVMTSAALAEEQLFPDPIPVEVPNISTDKTVNYDYDIVYVRADRAGDEKHKRFFTDFSQPVTMEPGADLMLLHPDGTEEVLVDGGDGSVTDPMICLDGQWVYYSYLYDLRQRNQWDPPSAGADIFKLHLKTRDDRQADDAGASRPTPARPMVERLPHGRRRQDALPIRRLQHGPLPAAGRQDRLHEQPRRLSPAEGLSGHRAPAVRDERRRDEHRKDRPPEHRRRLAPGGAQGRADHVQHARIAGHPQRHLLGNLDDPSRRHELESARQRASIRAVRRMAFIFKRSSPTGRSSSRSTTTRTTAALVPTSSCRRRSRRAIPRLVRATCTTSGIGPGGSAGSITAKASGIACRSCPVGSVSFTPFALNRRRPGRPCDPRRQEVARRRQVHASQRRTRQPLAHVLFARAGQPSVHLPAAARRRHLPGQGRQIRSSSRATCCSSRTTRTTTNAGRGRSCPMSESTAFANRSASSRWPTTAAARRICPPARRLAWSARRASTSARVTPTAVCRRAK